MFVRFLFCAVAAKWSLAGAWRGIALLWTSPVVSDVEPSSVSRRQEGGSVSLPRWEPQS